MYMPEDEETKEIIEYLREKLQIPTVVTNFSVHFCWDDILTVDCTYYPQKDMS